MRDRGDNKDEKGEKKMSLIMLMNKTSWELQRCSWFSCNNHVIRIHQRDDFHHLHQNESRQEAEDSTKTHLGNVREMAHWLSNVQLKIDYQF